MKVLCDIFGTMDDLNVKGSQLPKKVLDSIIKWYPDTKYCLTLPIEKKQHRVMTVQCLADFRTDKCPQYAYYVSKPDDESSIDFEMLAPLTCLTCLYSTTIMRERPFKKINHELRKDKRELGFSRYFGAWLGGAIHMILDTIKGKNSEMEDTLSELQFVLNEHESYELDKGTDIGYHR